MSLDALTARQREIVFLQWKGHDGICYLVPRVHTGCLLRGEQSRAFVPSPRLLIRHHRIGVHKPNRWLIVRPVRFHVAVLADGTVKIVSVR